jgi:hypothetical protein
MRHILDLGTRNPFLNFEFWEAFVYCLGMFARVRQVSGYSQMVADNTMDIAASFALDLLFALTSFLLFRNRFSADLAPY